jgi:hypothetical protein
MFSAGMARTYIVPDWDPATVALPEMEPVTGWESLQPKSISRKIKPMDKRSQPARRTLGTARSFTRIDSESMHMFVLLEETTEPHPVS